MPVNVLHLTKTNLSSCIMLIEISTDMRRDMAAETVFDLLLNLSINYLEGLPSTLGNRSLWQSRNTVSFG